MKTRLAILPAVLLAVACKETDDPSGSGTSDTESSSDEAGEVGSSAGSEAGSASGGSGESQGEGEASSSSTSEGGADEGTVAPVYARGIQINEVTVNQGVAVSIWKDGAWVGPEGRNAELVQNRETLLQATWGPLPSDWVTREIRFEVTIVAADGTTEVAKRSQEVGSGESYAGSLNRSFWAVLPKSLSLAGAQFQVKLFEVDAAMAGTPEPEPPPVVPPTGTALIGFQPDRQVLKAAIVPIAHEYAGGGTSCPQPAPTVTETDAKIMSEYMHLQNPTAEVQIRVREPMVYTQALDDFGPLLSALSQLRTDDAPDPAEYYYGVVNACDGGPDGIGGQAISIPDFPLMSNGWQRVAVGRWYGNVNPASGTFVHEIGHLQGRYHIACSGDEGGTDPTYPYPSGALGVWGFGIPLEAGSLAPGLAFSFHNPDSGRDYMTYCGSNWVSDWGWRKVYPVIQELSSWEGQSRRPDPNENLLIGMLMPSGKEEWFTVPGVLPRAPSPDHRIELEIDGATVVRPAVVEAQSDSRTLNVISEIPRDFERVSAISRFAGEQRFEVDPANVKIAHTVRAR